MKKIIAIILSLVMLLSMAACAPSEGTTDPATDAPTEKPTDKPTDPNQGGDIVIGDPTDPPTDPAPTDPPAPPELQANGICAVGIVDAEAGTAKILADNGAIAEIPYTCEGDPIPGNLYEFAKNGDVYTLTAVVYHNTEIAWNPRMWDNSGLGTADQMYCNDGTWGYMYDLAEDCVIFIRYSETEYRLFNGSDAIAYSEWPCWVYFTLTPYESQELMEDGNTYKAGVTDVILVVGDPYQGQMHANEAYSFFFDPEGYGWPDGDLIIE